MSERARPEQTSIDRRAFLVASCAGLASATTGQVIASGQIDPKQKSTAKSTILFFLCGGASHIDTWDMKPKAPLEYRGPFRPIETTAPGVVLCEHLPLLAKQAHHLAVVNSISGSVNTNDHHAGYYYNLTGHVPDPSFLALLNNRTPRPDDWPYMGTVVSSRVPKRSGLPGAITLPHKPSELPYTRPGQFAARLGIQHDPLYVQGSREKPLQFEAPALSLSGGIKANQLLDRRSLLGVVDSARRDLDTMSRVQTWTTLQERAWSLLASAETASAFDLSGESESVRKRYGETVNGMSLLLARRLVEAGVPFVTVFWMEDQKTADKCKSGGGWDTHGSNFACLKEDLLPEFDQGFSALIEDLNNRRLLDSTLLLVTSEMGRTPKIGDPRSGGVKGAGRDHWTHCLSDLLVGGGIRGGQTYGSSDRRAEYPANKPITPAHITKTVYQAMGVNDLSFTAKDGRVFSLLEEGEPLYELF